MFLSPPRVPFWRRTCRFGPIAAVLAVGVLPALAPASASAAIAPRTAHISVQLDYLENVQFGGSFVADSEGYYKKNGLSVTLLPGGSNVAVEPAVESGKALIGITHTTELAQAIASGADLKVVGAGYQKNPFCLISRAGDPITKPSQMVGKKIGVSDANQPLFASFLKANNIPASEVDIVTVQSDPTPLADRQVNGYVGFYTNEPIQLEEQGVKVHTLLMNDYGLPYMEELYIVRASSLKSASSRKLITEFMKAEQQGWAKTISDPALAARLAVTTYGTGLKLAMSQQLLEAKAQNALVANATTSSHGLFWMSSADVKATVKSLAIGGTSLSTGVFTNTILKGLTGGHD